MNGFQVAGVAVCLAFAALVGAALVRRRWRWRTGVPWLAVWLLAATAILYPGITVRIARALGIARGADFVFYCGLLAGMAALTGVWLRLRRTDALLTQLVRELALLEARVRSDATAEPRADPPDGGPRP